MVVSGVYEFPDNEIPLHLSVSGSLPWRHLFSGKGAPQPPTFVPRTVCCVGTVGTCCRPGDEFDFVGVAVAFGACTLETGDVADEKKDCGEPVELFLYATDKSENILAIHIRTRMGFQPRIPIGEVFTATNLLYSRFDPMNEIHVCDASDTVIFNQRPTKSHLAGPKLELTEWASTSHDVIDGAIQRASLIVDGIMLSQI